MAGNFFTWMEAQVIAEYYEHLIMNDLIQDSDESLEKFWEPKLPEKIDNPFFDVL